MSCLYISLCRVSTKEQGKSGLGLDAQQSINEKFVSDNGGELLASFREVVSGKDDVEDRPMLRDALRLAKRKGATVIVSRLDRLSRRVSVISRLQDEKVNFGVADLPDATTFTIHLYAALAQKSREDIADKTRMALQAKIRAGARLGLSNPNRTDALEVSKAGTASIKSAADKFALHMKPVIDGLRLAGALNTCQLAKALNAGNYKTARGSVFAPTTVRNILKRLEVLAA